MKHVLRGLQTKGKGSTQHTLGHSKGLTTGGGGDTAFPEIIMCALREKAGMRIKILVWKIKDTDTIHQ